MKGYIGTGILYLPHSMYMGGWLFSAIALFTSYVLSLFCMYLLVDVRKKIPGASYVEIGQKAFGNPGKLSVEIFLFLS